jgi:hypothetical protein
MQTSQSAVNMNIDISPIHCDGPRPIERRLESGFHKTEMKIWAGLILLAANIVLLKGQHFWSR